MNFKNLILSDVSVEAKVSALAIILHKEFPKLIEKVNTVEKLKGEQGDQGLQGDKGSAGKNGRDGSDGKNGKDGKDGKNGIEGLDGVSVIDAKVDFDDSLVFTLSNGKTVNVGEVKGEKGEKGERGAAGLSGGGGNISFYNADGGTPSSLASANVDGGIYNTNYGGTTALNAGAP